MQLSRTTGSERRKVKLIGATVTRKTFGFIAVILWMTAALWFVRVRSRNEFDNQSFISLSMKREGESVRLSWNASAVQHANNAVLWISDGTKQQRIDLTRVTLDKGNVLYTPESDEVKFKLEMLRIIASGSLHFIADQNTHLTPRASTSTSMPPNHQDQSTRVLAVAPRLAWSARRTRSTPSESETAPQPTPTVKVSPSQSWPLLISPPALITASPQPAPLPVLVDNPKAVPLPPTPVSTVTYTAAPEYGLGKLVKRAIRVSLLRPLRDKQSDISVEAIPRREVHPEVPSYITGALTKECRVILRASINKLGRVTDVEVLPPLADHRLVGLADSAVRQWEFEPAQSRRHPVPSRLIITFTFRNPRL